MKKLIAAILALGMITCSFAACGSTSSDSDDWDESSSQVMTPELLKTTIK